MRRANAYDTRLQMGRWFGYREDCVDLTRRYTTTELADNFRDLATYEEELRQEIHRYEQLQLTPTLARAQSAVHPGVGGRHSGCPRRRTPRADDGAPDRGPVTHPGGLARLDVLLAFVVVQTLMALTETAQSCSPKLLTLSGRQPP